MYLPTALTSKRGYTILLALGSIGVLLIIITGIARVYIDELQLSRMHYDTIIANAQSDGVFEYAMLKALNHRQGFQDSMGTGDIDAHMFIGSTPRTQSTSVRYMLSSQSRDESFFFTGHLIIPLFSGTGLINTGSITSYDPNYSTGVVKVKDIAFQALSNPENISWSIVGMSGGQNMSLAGTGDFTQNSEGISRFRGVECYDKDGNKGTHPGDLDTFGNCTGIYSETSSGETVEYFYDQTGSVSDFLTTVQDPYLMIFNSGSTALTGTIRTNTPFTLPTLTVTTEARKGRSMRSIQYREDTSMYYDALRYGIFMP